MRNRLFNPPLACILLVLAGSACLRAQISLSITVGPPPIPVYVQPPCPDNGYTFAPGYWALGEDGYFWVPGRKPNWAASTGPSSGPAAAMAAKWWPKTTNLLVFT